MTKLTRDEIDLTGLWQIAFDPQNEGVRQGWQRENWPEAGAQPVHVPGIWNIEYPDAEGVAFYRTSFTIPDAWRDRVTLLRFQGAIYRCEVWVNGQFVGGHEGGYTPFEFDVTRKIQAAGENTLVVRVAALSKNKSIDGMPLQHAPLSKQSWYYVYGGLWGRVTLEACPWIVCQSVSIDPNLQRERVQVELGMHNRLEECRQVEIHLKITDPRGSLACELHGPLAVPPGIAAFNYSFQLPRPLAWSCEQPNLYNLAISVVSEDGQVDEQSTAFGMRDFTVQDGRFFLNGEPVYLSGVLLQPNFPVHLIDHPSREMMVREISLVKAAGFNLLRAHLQPLSPEYLDLADEMGLLVYAETSLGWIRDNPRLMDHGRREIQAMIARDRNHPCIVFWGVYNENPKASAINGEALCRFARSLDPSRVIVEDSGGSLAIDQDFGWIDRARVTPAWEVQPQRIIDVHLYLGSPTPVSIYPWLSALGSGVSSRVLVDEQFGSPAVVDEFDRECRSYPGQILVSELGCGGMADLDEQVAGFAGQEDLLDARELKTLRDGLRRGFAERRLERIFGSRQRLFQEAQELQVIGNTQQIEALLANPRVSGFLITQLNDVAWEFHAGLLDVWRNPKPAYYAAQRTNQPRIVILRATQPTAAVGESVTFDLTLVSRLYLPPGAQVQVSVYDPDQEEIAALQLTVPLHPGIHSLESPRVETRRAGTYQVAARLVVDGKTLAQATESILALESVAWETLQVNVRKLGRLPGNVADAWPEGARSAAEISPTLILAALPSTLSADEWETLCAAVEAGAVAVVGALRPDHTGALRAFSQHGLALKLHFGIGSWMGCYHWVPQSDLFAGLPAGGLAKQPYTGVLPKYVLAEQGGEVLAGSLRNTQSRLEAPAMLWYSDVEVVSLGKGKIIFCQYRVFENMANNPLAARMTYNLLGFADRLLKSRSY